MKTKLRDISFEGKKELNDFYKKMWGNNNLELDVTKKESSCEFSLLEKSISKTLISNFEISNKNLFNLKLEQAISGDGSEDNKITNLRSSSLCSLLFFYNVSKDDKLDLELNGDICTFETSIFEFKNKVIKKPSNMDVVLLGYKKTDRNKKVILFLESKFSEYYFDVIKPENKYGVRYSYYKKYPSLYKKVLEELGYFSNYDEILKSDGKYFEIIAKQNSSYIEGIKQMISHYIGVKRFSEGDYSSEINNTHLDCITDFLNIDFSSKGLLDKLREDSDLYLGEIVFDGDFGKMPIEDGKTFLSDYEEKHRKLAEILEEDNKNKSIHIVRNLLHYSDYKNWNHIIEDRIINYYFGN